MGATSNQSKQRWNAAHYTQIKISVPSGLAQAFKAKCISGGVSFTAALSRFMREYSASTAPLKRPADPLASRPSRRKALAKLTSSLAAILDAEQRYLDNIPQNLQSSRFFDAAESSVSALEEAINILDSAY